MSRRTIALAVFLTAGVVVASEVSARIGMRPAAVIPYSAAAATESKPPTSERTLKWQACGEGPAECAVLRVPIVHGGAGGAAIGIKVIRVRARSPKRRIGVLVVKSHFR